MRVLSAGASGREVRRWQLFLRGQGHALLVSGSFDAHTQAATRAFQSLHGLQPDGIVGNRTLGQAMLAGFETLDYAAADAAFPPAPGFAPLAGIAARQKLFGKFAYVAAPAPGNAEAVRVIDDWAQRNLVVVEVPQLAALPGAVASGRLRFHRLAAAQLLALFAAWEAAGLMGRVLSWGGAYAARFIRGSRSVLSNHAFGSAFDINAAANPLGAQPALSSQPGCVYELVAIAHRHGFYWGGHFAQRRDGMHFEVAKLL